MPRVLYITTTIKDEGPGNLLGSLLTNLNRDLVDPYVLTVQGAGKWLDIYHKNKIPVKNLNLRTPLDFLSAPLIYQYIKKVKPDLIHTQLLTADLFGRLSAQFARVPYVTTIHNMDDWKRSAKPLSWGAKTMDAWQLKHANSIVAVSEAVKKDTVMRQRVPAEMIQVIRNAVDLKRFNTELSASEKLTLKKSLNIPTNSLVVGASSRLSKQKNPELWLALAKNIIKDFPQVHFIWAGDGPLQARIQSLVELNGLTNNVHLLGWRTDLPQLMQIIDVYTLISLWEGLPIALIEAMGAGRTCLVSNVSGNPEVVKHKKTGWLVPATDLLTIKTSLVTLLNNKQLRNKLAKNARSFVHTNFNLPRMIKEYEHFYDRVFSNINK